MRSHSLRAALASGLCLLAATGCRLSLMDLEPVTPDLKTFELAPVRVRPAPDGAWCGDKVAMVETFDSDGKYDERLYLKLSGTAVERSETRRWAQPPAEMLSARLLDALLQSGVFSHVVGPRSPIRPDVRVTGHVIAFDHVREEEGGAGKAVLRLAVALSTPRGAGKAGGVLWRRTLSLEQAVPDDSPEAFVQAMSANVAEAVSQIVEALATIRPDR